MLAFASPGYCEQIISGTGLAQTEKRELPLTFLAEQPRPFGFNLERDSRDFSPVVGGS